MPEEGIIRIRLDIAREGFAIRLRSQLVSAGGNDQPMQLLHAEMAVHELRCQPIEQLGIGGSAAEVAEIAGSFLKALAEMPLPDTVDGYAGEERISRRGEPVGEGLDAVFVEIDFRRRDRPTRLNRVI